MSRPLLRALLIVVLVALLLGLAVVAIRNGDLMHQQTAELPDLGEVPEFAFIDTSGETIRRADLDGDYWIVDFIFTRCTGTCPLLSSRMFAIQSALTDDDPVRLVSVSVDPEFDTPEVMAAYAERFKAEPGRWLFLTGDKGEIFVCGTGKSYIEVKKSSNGARYTEHFDVEEIYWTDIVNSIVENFIRAAQGKAKPFEGIGAREGRDVVRVMEAIYKAAASGKRITLE